MLPGYKIHNSILTCVSPADWLSDHVHTKKLIAYRMIVLFDPC